MRWGGFGKETMVSVLAKPWFELDISLALRRRDFVPPPRTDCVLFSARLREEPLVLARRGNAERWEAFVERGFGQGRGSVRRNLAGEIGYERFKRAARDLGDRARGAAGNGLVRSVARAVARRQRAGGGAERSRPLRVRPCRSRGAARRLG